MVHRLTYLDWHSPDLTKMALSPLFSRNAKLLAENISCCNVLIMLLKSVHMSIGRKKPLKVLLYMKVSINQFINDKFFNGSRDFLDDAQQHSRMQEA
jgi:hypothetical protein